MVQILLYFPLFFLGPLPKQNFPWVERSGLWTSSLAFQNLRNPKVTQEAPVSSPKKDELDSSQWFIQDASLIPTLYFLSTYVHRHLYVQYFDTTTKYT